ncbi:uncharacterized protein ASCRUDRAFT_16121, partial [Ascoidea rubescens DSM 1968]
PIERENASAIFNSVNGVLKQKDSDIFPNGVSIFTGFIPKGTFLYHSGRGFPTNPEWIAFDYEFSYNFGSYGDHDEEFNGTVLYTFITKKALNKVLILDGASAAKTTTGEMDSQVLLSKLPTNTSGWKEREMAERICEWGEKEFNGLDGIIRLEIGFEMIVCNFKSDKIELISQTKFIEPKELLDFPIDEEERRGEEEKEKEKKEFEVGKRNELFDGVKLNDTRDEIYQELITMAGYEHYKAGSIHYNGDVRVMIDFRGFVTGINRGYLNPDEYVRRLNDLEEKERNDMVNELSTILKRNQNLINYLDGTNWQTVTGLIIEKFYPILGILNQTYENYYEKTSGIDINKMDIFARNVSKYTFNFYRRYIDSNIKGLETRRATALRDAVFDYSHPYQTIQSESDLLIWSSISEISKLIISEVFSSFELSKEMLWSSYVSEDPGNPERLQKFNENILSSRKGMNSLLSLLNWSAYYQCEQKCPLNSLCFVPTWGPSPLG